MQDHDDRPAGASRPSLLSSASQADLQAGPDRQRILSSLDSGAGRAAPARKAPPRARVRGWAWGAAAVGAVAVALLVFVAGEDDEHVVPEPVHAAAGSAKVAAAAAVASAPAVPAPAPTESVDAAHAGAEAAPANPLADMAPTPTHAPAPGSTSKHDRNHAAVDPLMRALENKQARHSPASRKQRAPKHAAIAQSKPAPKSARQRAQNEPDSDVVLLAALMSHMDPRNRKATLEERLQTCKRYNAAGETECRARVCAGAERKEAACKGLQAARTAPES